MAEAKRPRAIAHSVAGTVHTFTFAAIGRTETIDFAALSEDVKLAAGMRGLKETIIDAAALERDTTTGRSATDSDKADAIAARIATLKAGEWAKRGGGTARPKYDPLYADAMAECYPDRNRAQWAMELDTFDPAFLAQFVGANPNVKAAYDRLVAARTPADTIAALTARMAALTGGAPT